MTSFNRFKLFRQQIASDSASWGSLLVLAIGVATLVLFMVLYSAYYHGNG